MKEIVVNDGEDILHLEFIEALGLLTAATVTNGYKSGEMIIDKIDSNHGSFHYVVSCEKIVEKNSLIERVKKWFK